MTHYTLLPTDLLPAGVSGEAAGALAAEPVSVAEAGAAVGAGGAPAPVLPLPAHRPRPPDTGRKRS